MARTAHLTAVNVQIGSKCSLLIPYDVHGFSRGGVECLKHPKFMFSIQEKGVCFVFSDSF